MSVARREAAVTRSLFRPLTTWGLVGLTVVLVATGAFLASWDPALFLLVPAVLAFSMVGAIITLRAPRNVIGPLLLTVGVAAAASAIVGTEWHLAKPPLQGREWGALLEENGSALWIAPLMLVLFRFPDGRPLSRGWRRMERLALLDFALLFLVGLLIPSEPGHLRNPLGVEGLGVLEGVALPLWILSAFAFLSGCVSFVSRFRRARGDEEGRMKWVAFAAAVLGVGFFTITASYFVPDPPLEDPDQALLAALVGLPFILGLSVFPIAVGIGILRHRLFDIDLVIRKTVVYGLLVTLVLAVAGLGGLLLGGLLVRPKDLSPQLLLLLGAAGGLLVWPLRRLAIRIAERVVFRGRSSPYEVLTEFSDRMSVAYATDDVLPRLAAVLGEGTGAGLAVVWLRIGNELRPESVWPSDAKPPNDLPEDAAEVVHQGEQLGALSVEMPANDPMNPTKREIVRSLAAQAGLVLRNVRLIEELRESRRRIVTAQDERAQKLERDIHDGAQQQLVALAVKQRLAAALVGEDDARARVMLDELAGETNEALDNLRDLARGIYPPLLADRGLAAALDSQARKSPVPVLVDADGTGRYPQEIESAVYFSILEALQNAGKYADASMVQVRLEGGEGRLRFSVEDDGRGFDASADASGTGLQGMADRLASIGGELQIASSRGSGTTISGQVPLIEVTR